MNKLLLEALAKLDPSVAEHWTADGLPRLDAVKAIYGQDVTREEINTAVKGFHKGNLEPLKVALNPEGSQQPNTPPEGHQDNKGAINSPNGETAPTNADGVVTNAPATGGTLPSQAHTAQVNANAATQESGEETLQKYDDEIAKLEKAIHASQNKLAQVREKRDHFVASLPPSEPTSASFSNTVKEFQESQKRIREERAEEDKRIKELLRK